MHRQSLIQSLIEIQLTQNYLKTTPICCHSHKTNYGAPFVSKFLQMAWIKIDLMLIKIDPMFSNTDPMFTKSGLMLAKIDSMFAGQKLTQCLLKSI